MSDLLRAEDLWKVYRLGEVKVEALRGVSMSIAEGEFKSLVGPSGSGKSTLMHLLGLLDWPTRGEVRFEGRGLSGLGDRDVTRIRARQIGFVFQSFNLMASLSVKDNVALQLRFAGVPRRERSTLAEEALEKVGLGNRMKHRPAQLSGGERQRVAIARATAKRPRLLLADEPTGNLDTQRSEEIFETFRELNEAGQTILVVTHNLNLANRYCDTVRMQDGRLVPDDVED